MHSKDLKRRTLLVLSLSLNLCGAVLLGVVVARKGGLPWVISKIPRLSTPALRGDYPNTKGSVYDELPIGPADTVFLGDSIFDFAEWSELMDDAHAKNRGIAGDTTGDILQRLPAIASGKPTRVILLCGINDLQRGVSPGLAESGYAQIVKRLREWSPQTELWLLPVLPVNQALYRQWIVPEHPTIHMPAAEDVTALNNFISSIREEKVRVVPTSSLLQNGQLSPVYTFDGLHLNGKGLKELAAVLRKQ